MGTSPTTTTSPLRHCAWAACSRLYQPVPGTSPSYCGLPANPEAGLAACPALALGLARYTNGQQPQPEAPAHQPVQPGCVLPQLSPSRRPVLAAGALCQGPEGYGCTSPAAHVAQVPAIRGWRAPYCYPCAAGWAAALLAAGHTIRLTPALPEPDGYPVTCAVCSQPMLAPDYQHPACYPECPECGYTYAAPEGCKHCAWYHGPASTGCPGGPTGRLCRGALASSAVPCAAPGCTSRFVPSPTNPGPCCGRLGWPAGHFGPDGHPRSVVTYQPGPDFDRVVGPEQCPGLCCYQPQPEAPAPPRPAVLTCKRCGQQCAATWLPGAQCPTCLRCGQPAGPNCHAMRPARGAPIGLALVPCSPAPGRTRPWAYTGWCAACGDSTLPGQPCTSGASPECLGTTSPEAPEAPEAPDICPCCRCEISSFSRDTIGGCPDCQPCPGCGRLVAWPAVACPDCQPQPEAPAGLPCDMCGQPMPDGPAGPPHPFPDACPECQPCSCSGCMCCLGGLAGCPDGCAGYQPEDAVCPPCAAAGGVPEAPDGLPCGGGCPGRLVPCPCGESPECDTCGAGGCGGCYRAGLGGPAAPAPECESCGQPMPDGPAGVPNVHPDYCQQCQPCSCYGCPCCCGPLAGQPDGCAGYQPGGAVCAPCTAAYARPWRTSPDYVATGGPSPEAPAPEAHCWACGYGPAPRCPSGKCNPCHARAYFPDGCSAALGLAATCSPYHAPGTPHRPGCTPECPVARLGALLFTPEAPEAHCYPCPDCGQPAARPDVACDTCVARYRGAIGPGALG